MRFFLETNPTYDESNGLLTLFPIDAPMLAAIGTRIARERARKLVDTAMVRAQRLPLGRRLLRPRQVRAHLQASPLFATLDEAGLAALMARADVVTMSAGTSVFRQGDPGRDVYLVARGAVYVLGDNDAVIDQLGTGAIFGEFAALCGTLRTASVRAAIPSTLVRIPAEAIRALMRPRRSRGARPPPRELQARTKKTSPTSVATRAPSWQGLTAATSRRVRPTVGWSFQPGTSVQVRASGEVQRPPRRPSTKPWVVAAT
ncbi:MAG: cyclic nucleotide-binding domain-containing protein, partial [Polyangiales bacterium]